METTFTPGQELSKRFYWEVIRPILDANYPDIQHGAALIGDGSEVLGFDTALSTDHDWGPRVMLFLTEEDYPRVSKMVGHVIRSSLPNSFLGYAVEPKNRTKESHSVEILTLRAFLVEYLGFDICHELEPADWLTFPEQKLRALTQGAIYWDGADLQEARRRFEYYPHDVWLYMLAAGWTRIGQEEHLMGRAGIAGDEIGSSLIAARLVRDLMQLCFLMEKRYAPYAKWFGTAFAQLASAEDLAPILQKSLTAADWTERERHLVSAYELVATRHNVLGITEPLNVKASYFFERPFLVIGGERFAQAICAQVVDPVVKQIASRRLIGSIDQFSDSTDILCDIQWRTALRQLYEN
ncbi:MAG: DUF4037 domain-containing protein [Anaerolineae bacterium]|nr:DUF4037 domain-containing protein [Anaerolineae bacterium]